MDWADLERSDTLNDQCFLEADGCEVTYIDLSQTQRLVVRLLACRRGTLVSVHEMLFLCSGIFDSPINLERLDSVLGELSLKLPATKIRKAQTSNGPAYRID